MYKRDTANDKTTSTCLAALLVEDASDRTFVQTVTRHPLLAANTCFNQEQLMSAVAWELPNFIFLDGDAFGERLESLLDDLLLTRWYIHIVVSSSAPEEIFHLHPFLVVVPPTITQEALSYLIVHGADCWRSEVCEEPLGLADHLQMLCQDGRSKVSVCELSNSESAVLEIISGELWNVTVSNLQGEPALRRMSKYLILSVKQMEVDFAPLSRKIKCPWKMLLEESTEHPAPTVALGGRETRSDVEHDANVLSGLLLTAREDMFFESLAQAEGFDAAYASWLQNAENESASFRFRFQLLAELAQGNRDKASAAISQLAEADPTAPCLQARWGQALLQVTNDT